MSMSRKDSKGRVLRKGESQRKNDGRYIYQYTDSTGKRRVVYSNDLLELREKEKNLFAISWTVLKAIAVERQL